MTGDAARGGLHATAAAQESPVRPGPGDHPLLGKSVGLAVASGESRVLSSQLFGVTSTVPAARTGVPWS
jgi:hypothetical protein